jgi:uncharacterized protein (DUF1501 family)
MNRRQMLSASLAAAGGGFVPGFWRSVARAQTVSTKHVVFIFMRGGVDGLSLVSPTGAAYNALKTYRPTLSITSPISYSASLCLHPQLAPLLNDSELKAHLNFVVQAGSVRDTRSHFVQMAHVEAGDSSQIPNTGFLGVTANVLARNAVGIGMTTPPSLKGTEPLVLTDPERLGANYADGNLKPGLSRAQRLGLYKKLSGEIGDAAVDAVARKAESQFENVLGSLGGASTASLLSRGGYDATSPFAKRLAVAGAMLSSSANPAVLTLDADQGWDTHSNQVTNSTDWHTMGRKIDDLARALALFKKDLVTRGKWGNTVVVLLSEFGRTVKENGSRGTDHGRGGLMILMGGSVRPHSDPAYLGARAYSLPTTADSSTALTVLHDYRVVMAEIIHRHLGVGQTQACSLFNPAGSVQPNQFLNVLV